MEKKRDSQIQNIKKKPKVLTHYEITEFEKLNWKQIDDLDRKLTIFFLPVSPLEEHGPHLPVGTDLLISKDTTIEAIRIIQEKHDDVTCVILPSIPAGYCKFNTDFPGTISISSKVVRDLIYGYGSALGSHGFSNMIICTYHMALGHLKGIYVAMDKLRRKYRMNICEPWSPVFYNSNISDNEPKLGFDTSKDIHAGFRETSLIKYQYPYLLDPIYTSLQSIYRDANSPKVIGKTFKQIGLNDGYIGNPSKADLSYGRWFFHFTADTYVNAAEALLKGKPLPDLPKKVKSQMKMLFWQ